MLQLRKLLILRMLSDHFASTSRGTQLQLRAKLRTYKYEGSIPDYMLKIRHYVDEIVQIDELVCSEDLTDTVFNGLYHDTFGPIINAVRARDTPIS